MSDSNQISFPRSESKVIVAAFPEGVLIIYGWTMSITLSNIKQYVKNFGHNSHDSMEKGFFQVGSSFILSHSGAKMMFSTDEASAVIDLLVEYYNIIVPGSSRIVEPGLVKGHMS